MTTMARYKTQAAVIIPAIVATLLAHGTRAEIDLQCRIHDDGHLYSTDCQTAIGKINAQFNPSPAVNCSGSSRIVSDDCQETIKNINAKLDNKVECYHNRYLGHWSEDRWTGDEKECLKIKDEILQKLATPDSPTPKPAETLTQSPTKAPSRMPSHDVPVNNHDGAAVGVIAGATLHCSGILHFKGVESGEWKAKLEAVEVIQGCNLELTGGCATLHSCDDLSFFRNLRLLSGWLRINHNGAGLSTLKGAFPALTTIGKQLGIGSNAWLADMSGAFAKLTQVGGVLSLNHNPKLMGLGDPTAFPALQVVATHLNFPGNGGANTSDTAGLKQFCISVRVGGTLCEAATVYYDSDGWLYDAACCCPGDQPPTFEPTSKPTPKPTEAPTLSPTEAPNPSPSKSPTKKPTPTPTKELVKGPTQSSTPSPATAPPDSSSEGKKTSSGTAGIIVTVVLVALALLGLGVGVACMMLRKRDEQGDVVEVAEKNAIVHVGGDVAVAETTFGKLFAVPFDTEEADPEPPVYEEDTPFGLRTGRALQPINSPPIDEDGYVADPSHGSTRPLGTEGYVLDQDLGMHPGGNAVYAVPNDTEYLVVQRTRYDTVDTGEPLPQPEHESAQLEARYNDVSKGDIERVLRVVPAPTDPNEGYELVDRVVANPAEYDVPECQPRDYTPINAQQPYEDLSISI